MLRPKGQGLAVVDYARAGATTKGEKPVPRQLRLRGSGPHAAAQPGTAAATEVEHWDFRTELGPDGTVPLLVVRPKRPKKGEVRRRVLPRCRPQAEARVPDRSRSDSPNPTPDRRRGRGRRACSGCMTSGR